MFPITRAAATITKFERQTAKFLNKAVKDKIISEQNSQFISNRIFEKTGGSILPAKKNIFKKAIYWIKTFIKNYKSLKETMAFCINSNKEKYGKLFTDKRQKKYYNGVLSSVKKELRDAKLDMLEMLNAR